MSFEVNALVIVPAGAPASQWHAGRDEGVTASDIHAIASGSRSTQARILDGKLNGATFKGNAATRRGHLREPEIVDAVAKLPGVRGAFQSTALLGHRLRSLHRATPDGFGVLPSSRFFGIEGKSHDESWGDRTDIPADHYDQAQWGMWVTDLDVWCYAWLVEGGQVQYRWIDRDEARIARLVAEADRFIAWRAAGAPMVDEIPEEVEAALRLRLDALTADKRWKTARKDVVDPWLEATHPDSTARVATSVASLTRTVDEVDVIDEEAWRAGDPDGWAQHEDALIRAQDATEAAEALRLKAIAGGFTKKERKVGNLLIAPTKTKEKAA